jgi:hypothetical protein
MVVKKSNKNALVGMIIAFLLSSPVFANNWKHIENNKTDKVSTYIQTNTIRKDSKNVTYTTRLKIKNTGDYINVVYTNCSDFSSATLGTYEFDKNFSIYYENLTIPSELMPLDKTSLLYNVASVACTLDNSYNVKKAKSENLFVKVMKGLGTVLACVLIAPFYLVAAVLGAL